MHVGYTAFAHEQAALFGGDEIAINAAGSKTDPGNPKEMLAFLLEVSEGRGHWETVFLFGHSFGGLVSLEAALLTDKVSRLILYEPPVPTGVPTIPEDVLERIQVLTDRGELEEAMGLFLREVAKLTEDELQTYRQTPL